MSNLTTFEKQLFEKLFDMQTGYVLDFSNKTFQDFVKTSVNRDIFDKKYEKICDELGYDNCSKANRLRCFWDIESDSIVYKLVKELLKYYEHIYDDEKDWELLDKAKNLVNDSNSIKTIFNDEETFLKKEFEVIDISSLGIEESIVPIIISRIEEIKICLENNVPLSSIFLIGSTLEGILLGVASQYPEKYGRAKSSPKDKHGKVKRFDKWSLNDLINVSYEIGFLKKDVKEFSHYLRDFRNYIHPYKQLVDKFYPNNHTALICEQVLKAAIYELSKINE
ncbi:MAG: hypothetical protein KO318_04935 [Methanobacterium sp.]|jgi:hypothetical protein|uniref:hypothetical protein n=1 Tax=Methanobacterium sp. TaxID=2164 RepID=UPI002584F1CD|nr:hypothetical protein [Methanobacterium sp.]MCC7559759.1 hypothetical protein [Methanobacterium sp.]